MNEEKVNIDIEAYTEEEQRLIRKFLMFQNTMDNFQLQYLEVYSNVKKMLSEGNLNKEKIDIIIKSLNYLFDNKEIFEERKNEKLFEDGPNLRRPI